MKNLYYFFRRVRTLIGLVATLVFFLTVLLPPVLGLISRQIITGRINTLPDAILADFNLSAVSAQTVRTGWFSSDVGIRASGRVLSADGQSSADRSAILHLNHGPIIWHLSDSLMALAEMQVLPLVTDAGPEQHFSGSAIVTLTPALAVRVSAIGGIQASGGEHWIEMYRSSPLLPLIGTTTRQIWFDLDMDALRAAGLGDQIARWQLEPDARISNNRLLFNIGAH